ncbi:MULTISPECIES: hypothetical protein [unclassified Pseudofrankia]|uniref:hypothetical protein n=1 Tax=unclassified Pseudofrankia TaxID=2994372 RepID=UPI0008DB023A|nr:MULTISPECIES: hypothetical protein [unclassified Pseudofrankia]MDT3440824.1 hypothetical protein [Pseudofrankia sp. BMG5.37]OHV43668.1 hypothetical protein BCD48_27160 [Pseudofrankia sp. BMG5.36]
MRVWRGGLVLAGTVVPAVAGSWVVGPAAQAASPWNSTSESQSAQLACSESDGVKVGSANDSVSGMELGQLWYSPSCRTVWGKWLGNADHPIGPPKGWLIRSDGYSTPHEMCWDENQWCSTIHINDAGYTTKLQVEVYPGGPIRSTPQY